MGLGRSLAPTPDINMTGLLAIIQELGEKAVRQESKRKKQGGFASIVEVAVTAVIFILATVGIISTVSALKPHARESTKKIEAAYVGKGIIDELRKEVNAAPGGVFFGNNLSIGTHTRSAITTTGTAYTVTYDVTEPIPNVRKVTMTVTWPN
jgi:hypothetical protein